MTEVGTVVPHYKWVALSNTTLGLLMATINSSIVLIALPDIFRGIDIDPLAPSNTGYLLWMIMGFLVVTAVLVVGFGRLGDMYGRVRMYNLGFVIFTIASVLLAVTWQTGDAAALWLIGWRVVQGIGGAFLMANSSAILTDAFPADQRGSRWGSTASRRSRARSSGWCWAACSARPTGTWSSSCPCRSASSARSGRSSSCATPAGASPRRWTGGATSRSRSG